jgi:hypothetical protein
MALPLFVWDKEASGVDICYLFIVLEAAKGL